MGDFEDKEIDDWGLDGNPVERDTEVTEQSSTNEDSDYGVGQVKNIPGTIKDEVYNITGSLRHQLTKGLKHIFVRDLTFHWYDVVQIIFQGLIVAGIGAFFVTALSNSNNNWEIYQYTQNEQIWLYVIVGLSIFFGGIFVDRFMQKKYYFEFLTGISIICMGLMGYTGLRLVSFISATFLAITGCILVISFFINIIDKTTLLNRGRFISFVVLLMMLSVFPLIIGLSTMATYQFYWLIMLLLNGLLIAFTQKYRVTRELRFKTPKSKIKDGEFTFSLKSIFSFIKKTKIMPYLSFMFLIAIALGFFLNNVIDKTEDLNTQLWIAAITALISFPTIGILMDNAGRKPIAILAATATGFISIFSDYPSMNLDTQTQGLMLDFRVAIFTFASIVIIIFTVVIAGDKSNNLSRGKIMGLFLFATIGGVIIGVQLERQIFPENLDEKHVIYMADWGSAIIFSAVVLFSTSSESFDFRTTFWRHFLDKIYLLTDTGTALYSYNFSKFVDKRGGVSEDLVSGGLTGIQSMLQEISRSKESIKVLDHGDLKIIFHHGKYTTAVLFVTKELYVFHEKLNRFHKSFEYMNKDELKDFHGNISKLYGIDELRRKYFT